MHPFYSPSSMATENQGFDLTTFCTRIPIWITVNRLIWKKISYANFKTFSTVFPGRKKATRQATSFPASWVLNSMSLIPPVVHTFDYTDGFWAAKIYFYYYYFFTPALRSSKYRKIPKISPSNEAPPTRNAKNPPLNHPSKYKPPPEGLCLAIALKY